MAGRFFASEPPGKAYFPLNLSVCLSVYLFIYLYTYKEKTWQDQVFAFSGFLKKASAQSML